MSAPLDPALLADMREALLSEFGARAIYARFAARASEPELARLAESFGAEESLQIERLRALLARLGSPARTGSRRREILARALAATAGIGGRALALRLCHASESTLARRYRGYARYLERTGDLAGATECDELAVTKERHANALEAWVHL